MDVTLEELIERVRALKSFEAVTLAKKVENNWNEGIAPNKSEIKKLQQFLNVDGPCERLTDNGYCNGWLRRNVELFDIPINPPYNCPFTEKKDWTSCYGYRKIK